MHVADSSGTLREVTDMWVWDGSSWREVVDGWTANSSGSLQQWVNFGGEVTVTVTPIDHLSFRVGWQATDATQVAIKVNGVTVYTALTATGSWVVGNQTPSSTVSVSATATWTGGTTKDATAVLTTLPNIPAPSSVGISGTTGTSTVISWAAVSGATSYEVYNADTNGLLTSTSQLTWTRTPLTPGTTYRMYVRARYNVSVVSVPSTTVTATTTASFPAGTYYFYAKDSDTLSPGGGADWRGTADGTSWHGYYSSIHGSQLTYFFDYRNASNVTLASFFAGGLPVNVASIEIWVARVDWNHGTWSPQLCRFYRHQHTSKPAAGSATTTGDALNTGTLDLADAKWITLDKTWAADLISGSVKGLCWGGTPSTEPNRYMIGWTVYSEPQMGMVRITVV